MTFFATFFSSFCFHPRSFWTFWIRMVWVHFERSINDMHKKTLIFDSSLVKSSHNMKNWLCQNIWKLWGNLTYKLKSVLSVLLLSFSFDLLFFRSLRIFVTVVVFHSRFIYGNLDEVGRFWFLFFFFSLLSLSKLKYVDKNGTPITIYRWDANWWRYLFKISIWWQLPSFTPLNKRE